MNTISRSELEVMVLKELDPYMRQLIISAPLVAIYNYDMKKKEWTSMNYEGVFFIYKTSNIPRYHMLLLNRLTDKHFIRPLSKNLQFQFEDCFIIYQDTEGQTYGLWFHENNICKQVASEILKILHKIGTEDSKTAKGDKVDIVAMLQEAEIRYEEKNLSTRKMSIINESADLPSPNVATFFLSAAKTRDNVSNHQKNDSCHVKGFLKKLKDNPKYDVQNIEKHQLPF